MNTPAYTLAHRMAVGTAENIPRTHRQPLLQCCIPIVDVLVGFQPAQGSLRHRARHREKGRIGECAAAAIESADLVLGYWPGAPSLRLRAGWRTAPIPRKARATIGAAPAQSPV